MEIFESKKICTDSHYEKSIAEAAAKVKSFLILSLPVSAFLTKLNNYGENFACFCREILR
jgi:hypothetical protein